MDILSQVYHKTLADNERGLRFCEDYLQSLKNLDFSVFSAKLKVPALVPIGSRILFRGELKHTNEVTIALGADYFVKCSLKQAEEIKQHRIKVAQAKLDEFVKEREYLENQISFTKQNVHDTQGLELVEYQTVEEDEAWRVKHRENVRQYMQNRSKEKQTQKDETNDEELWDRLEELELQEDLEYEMNEIAEIKEYNSMFENKNKESFIDKEDSIKLVIPKVETNTNQPVKTESNKNNPKTVSFQEDVKQDTKHDLLQQVIDRQNELEERLLELKNKERAQSKTENELMSRLDELEQLDELEDEMDRLDDIIVNEDVDEAETDEETFQKSPAPKLSRRVSFIDDEDSETLELTFKHSPVESSKEPYDPDIGITKPSDIYEAHSNCFDHNSTMSILKKSKYKSVPDNPEVMNDEYRKSLQKSKDVDTKCKLNGDSSENDTIVIKDVVEQVTQQANTLESKARPTSLFKKKRLQNKS